jgi:hypothetical protein
MVRLSPPWRGIRGRLCFRDSSHSLPLFPLGWCAFALLAIVRLLCLFPYTITAPIKSKRHHGPYKPRIMYHMQGMVRGRQRGTAETGRTASTGQAMPEASAYSENPLADHRPHHTGLTPDLLLARALRWGKYPLSKIFCAKVTRQVIICNERYNAMGRYLSVV